MSSAIGGPGSLPAGSGPGSPPAATASKPLDENRVFRTLFSAYPDALIVADASGHIVMANPSAARLLGYTSDELVGLDVDTLVPDAIRPAHAAYRHAYGRNPRPRPMGMHMDLTARRRDGTDVMVEIALSPLQSEGLPLVVAAIRDIGAYPRVKQALQRARYSETLAQLGRLAVDSRDWQALLDQVPAVVAEALQVDVAVVYLLEPNRQHFCIEAGVGLLPDEAVGSRVSSQPQTLPGFVLAQGEAVTVEDFQTERRFEVRAGFVQDGLRSGLAVPMLDRGRVVGALSVRSRLVNRFGADELRFLESLSSLLATSLQRARSEEALNHAQRLESVGQLTGGIAHDFNNLLTVIQGNLQVLEELPALVDDTHGQHLLAAAARASRRGAELTGKLLAFSRRQVLQPSRVDVHALLNALADMLRRTLDQRIRIEVAVAPGCPAALADPGQLESTLLNIAINARDAMPEGGGLRFQAELCHALPGNVRDALDDPGAPDDAFVAIAIADTGSGMSDDVKERAFEPFFTTKEAGRGTGLGLSTVYGFVKQSRGAVGLDTAPGMGTTLTLYIPRHRLQAEPAADVVVPTQSVPPGLKVLLVEDDAEVRAVALAFLGALHCDVTAASSAEQALLALGPEARFDVLLSDIALGAGMRGTELAAQARLRLPQVAVLLMSGYSAELLDADRDAPPSWELLRKPFSRDELTQAIARALAARAG